MPPAQKKILNLFPEGKGRCLRVELRVPPVPEEVCSITSEPIGSPDAEVPYAPEGRQGVFAALPALTCAQLPCGHRFHATAVLVHLMRNGLRCPLCRAGAGGVPRRSRLPLQETWFAHTAAAIERDRLSELAALEQEDRAMARELAMSNMSPLSMVELVPEQRVIVWATIWLRDPTANVDLAGVVIPLSLAPQPLQAGVFEYTMTNVQLRELTRAAGTLEAPSMSITLHATRFTEVFYRFPKSVGMAATCVVWD